MSRTRLAALSLALLLPLAVGCVKYPNHWDRETQGNDPFENQNRAVFEFNEDLDTYVLDPVASGWEFITFEGLRESVQKFFINLAFPRRFFANLGQAEGRAAMDELGRFLLNTTVGIGGLFDPATHVGIPLHNEDFGQMFGAWGIGTGPFWVLPFFGPSNPRDAVGLVFDLAFDLRTIASATPIGTLAWTGAIQNVNRRALVDEDIDLARDAALDLYVFSRDAYGQRRDAAIANRDFGADLPEEDGDSLYDFPDE